MKNNQPISLPQGVRDILPEDARRITFVESCIVPVFERQGFKRIITPILEYVDVLNLGLDQTLGDRLLKFIDPFTGRVMAVRPDITPQIARVVATRMMDSYLPLKLWYNENVVCYTEPGKGRTMEVLQLGAEQFTERPSASVDAEMIIMAIEALIALSLKDFKIDIGDVGFVRAALDRLAVDDKQKARIKDAIKIKDSSALETALKDGGSLVGKKEKDFLITLTRLYGEDEVLISASEFAKTVSDESLLKVVENLKEVISMIEAKGYKSHITIDLAEVRGFDYYTGMIFEGFGANLGRPLVSGGRYDTLLQRYGQTLAATGFAFDMEGLVSELGDD
ncbi:MAG: ATP phosphoribosyltransferase regulatory subunit [Deltaproteobacteria bacterium]|nr:ATP phosphoribosyltransferase regulatory subunit [Deltaproteobacteria bacterium]